MIKLLSPLFIGISFFSFGQSAKLAKKIDSLVETQNPRLFNGVILISKNGKAKYAKAHGFANFTDKKLISLENQFEIMSNTKLFTAVLILKEVEKGKIHLQSSIKTYLPELRQTWAETVTVHQLLNHTHGIADIEKPLLFTPGTQFKYGNISNILLGKILENINKKSYSEQANDFFKTIGLKNTFCYSEINKNNLAKGYMNKNNNLSAVEKTFINNENMPADGVISTAKDLAIWDAKLHQGKILNPETYQLLIHPDVLSEHNTFGTEKHGYGYAIRITQEKGIDYLGHTGLGDGFASMNIYIPSKKISLIILENQMSEDNTLYYSMEKEIKNLLLEDLKK